MNKLIGLLAALALWLPLAATAQAPSRLGYQGRLLKSDGTPASGVQTMGFALYDAPTGGTSLWSESQQVALTNGFYAVYLGDATPAGCTTSCTGIPASIFDGSERYLEITVGSTALTPRQRVDSVAYALMATNVKGGTVDATSISVGGATVINSSGNLTGPAAYTAGSGLDLSGNTFALTKACSANQILEFDGASWLCTTPSQGTTYTAGSGISIAGTTISLGTCPAGQVWTSTGAAFACAAPPTYAAGTGLVLTGNTFSLAYVNGCMDGTVEQTWPGVTNMVGCDYGVALPIRYANAMCAPGWHVCNAQEWNSRRGTTLSNAYRWIEAVISCNGCAGDILSATPAVDLCDYNPGSCGVYYSFFVGPAERDFACGSTWPAGINNGDLGRVGQTTTKEACLATIGTGANLVGGTMCCK